MFEAYCDRNAALISEVATKLKPVKGAEVKSPNQMPGYSYNTRFYQLGSFHSDVLNGEIFVGLKQYRAMNGQRAMSDLATVRVFYERVPGLRPELPQFLGLLRDLQGQELGVLTEDFSQGGSFVVEELGVFEWDTFPEGVLPTELREIIGGKPISDFDLARACFIVNGCRRIGDFNGLLQNLNVAERLKKFPIDDLIDDKDFEKYTIHL